MYFTRVLNKSRESGKTIVITWQPLSKHGRNIMKEQRLVNTLLPSGAGEDESPRVRDIDLCIPILSGL